MKIAAIVRTNLSGRSATGSPCSSRSCCRSSSSSYWGSRSGRRASARIGVVNLDGGPVATDLVTSLTEAPGIAVDVRTYDTADALRDAASRGIVSAAIVIPAGYSDALAAGGRTEVTVLTPPTQRASAVRTMVDEAIAREVGVVRAAQFGPRQPTGQSFGPRLRRPDPGRHGRRRRCRRSSRQRGHERVRRVWRRRAEPARGVHVPDIAHRIRGARGHAPARDLAAHVLHAHRRVDDHRRRVARTHRVRHRAGAVHRRRVCRPLRCRVGRSRRGGPDPGGLRRWSRAAHR